MAKPETLQPVDPTLATPTRGIGCALVGDIRTLEHSLDNAIISHAQLVQTLTEGRIHLGLSATFGHAHFEDAATVLGSLVKTRGDIVTMHNRLARQAGRLGVDVTTLGVETKPTDGSTESPVPKG